MSWSVSVVGRPHAVKKALEAMASEYSGQSREEYERAMPHLIALVALNEKSNSLSNELIHVDASGSMGIQHGLGGEPSTITYANCTVSIKRLTMTMVEG